MTSKLPILATVAFQHELPAVELLIESVHRFHPEARIHTLVLDSETASGSSAHAGIQLWVFPQLHGIPRWRTSAFCCQAEQLKHVAIPAFLDELIAIGRWPEGIFYFDAFSEVYAPLDTLFELINAHDIVVAPKLTRLFPDPAKPDHAQWKKAGPCSVGWIGLSASTENREHLRRWRQGTFAFHFQDNSAHYDDFHPEDAAYLCESSLVYSPIEYSLSYWNLHQVAPNIHFTEGVPTIAGEPLRIAHFFEVDDNISSAQTRFSLKDSPAPLQKLFGGYWERLTAQGYKKAASAWDYFNNGVRIPRLARELYRQHAVLARRWENPFDTSTEDSLLAHWSASVGLSSEPLSGGIPRLLLEWWLRQPGIQQRFPDPLAQHREALVGALREQWDKEEWDDAFLPDTPLPQALARARMQAQVRRVKHSSRQLVRKAGGKVLRRVLSGRKDILDRYYFSYLEREQGRVATTPSVPDYTARQLPASDSESDAPLGLNIAGYLTGEFGLAEAGRGIIRAVRAVDLPHMLRNYILPSHRWGDTTFTEFSDLAPFDTNLLMFNGPELPWIQTEFGDSWFAGKYNIGLWYWETQRIPDDWYPSMTILDEVWVTSEYVAEAVRKMTAKPVTVIKNPIQIDLGNHHFSRADFGLPEDIFLFLFSFDFHSYVERKNPMAIVEAYIKSFRPGARVGVVIKCLNSKSYREKFAALKESLKDYNAYFIDGYLSREEMFGLIQVSDCYISLHKSEGLGLGMAEAMFLGKPVIGTGFSGNMEFMNEDNSFPIRYSLYELEEDYGVYKKGSVWANPDVDHAAEVMKRLVDEPDLARRVGQAGQQWIFTEFSPKAAGEVIVRRLQAIRQERHR